MIPPLVLALCQQLPVPGTEMTTERRQVFVRAFSAMIEVLYPVAEAPQKVTQVRGRDDG